jgi:Cu(I)/Ag(I) efflux system membrane protein CusA/SilA
VLLATLFLIGGGLYAVKQTPLDALPDLSDVQVIVYTDYPGQAPQVVEDQVTYPLTTAMLAVPRAKVVRGFSFFGASFVYVIFEDGTDIYWARSRVLEYLNTAAGRLPQGVAPQLGPGRHRRGLGLPVRGAGRDMSLAELRAACRTGTCATSSPRRRAWPRSPASAASCSSTRSPSIRCACAGYGIRSTRSQAIRASNRDVGGRVVEMAETEYMVRGRGYLRGVADIESIVLKAERGTPVLVRDVARSSWCPTSGAASPS